MARPWDYDQAITRGCFGGVRPEPAPLTTTLGRLAVVATVGLLVVALLIVPLPGPIRVAWAVAFLVASVGALLAWVRSYGVLLERAHRANLDRQARPGWRRWATFLAAMLGYPAITLAGLFAIALTGMRIP